MKQSILVLISLIAFPAFGQNVNLKKLSIQTIAGTDYFVRADTAATGDIFVTLRPVGNEAALLADQLQGVENEIAGYDARIDELQNAKKDAQSRKKEIEKLQAKIQANRTITDPVIPSPAPDTTIKQLPKKNKKFKG